MSTYGRQEHLLGLWKGNSNVTILIDADGCPVVDLTVQTAAKYKVPMLILCDTAHQIQRAGKHPKGASKRTKEQDITYRNTLGRILQTV